MLRGCARHVYDGVNSTGRNAEFLARLSGFDGYPIPVDVALQALLQRPSVQRVVARTLRNLDGGYDTAHLLTDDAGDIAFLRDGAVQCITKGLEEEIQSARDNNIGPHECLAIQNTRTQFLGWLDAFEKQRNDVRVVFLSSDLSLDDFQAWLPQFQATHGVGVYLFDSLSLSQQQMYLKSLSPDQRRQWAIGYADYQSRNHDAEGNKHE
jgi:hypothetical protein